MIMRGQIQYPTYYNVQTISLRHLGSHLKRCVCVVYQFLFPNRSYYSSSSQQIDWEENDWEILEQAAAVEKDDHHHVCLHHCWKDQCTSSILSSTFVREAAAAMAACFSASSVVRTEKHSALGPIWIFFSLSTHHTNTEEAHCCSS